MSNIIDHHTCTQDGVIRGHMYSPNGECPGCKINELEERVDILSMYYEFWCENEDKRKNVIVRKKDRKINE